MYLYIQSIKTQICMFVIQNPTTEIEIMAVFLNVQNSTKFYGKVAESCSFEKLKQDLWKTRWP